MVRPGGNNTIKKVNAMRWWWGEEEMMVIEVDGGKG